MSSEPALAPIASVPVVAISGWRYGALLAWRVWFLAAFLQYFVARRTARDFDFEHARARLPRRLRELPASHPAFLILARGIPWGPHLVNTAAGAYGVSLVRHGWCAAVSILPQALLASAIGNGLFR